MKHVLNCTNQVYVTLSIEAMDDNYIEICINDHDIEESMYIIVDKKGLFNLIGSLHHFQKQLKP